MHGIEQALNNLFPVSWLDPYGKMPQNKELTVQIDITQVETDDGIRVTAVKTPPRASTTSIQDAISMALGMGCDVCEAPTGSPQSADLGKRKRQKDDDKKESSGKMEQVSPEDSNSKGRNLGPQGSRPEPSRQGATKVEDAKEKPQE